MTRQEFNDGFAALAAAFPNSDRSIEATQEIYWQMLQEIPAEVWQAGVKECLREKTFFPTIHDLGVACYGETKEEILTRCDPWRTIQFYKEKIEAVSWEENLRREVHKEQYQIEQSQRRKRIERRRSDPVAIGSVLGAALGDGKPEKAS